MTTDGPIRPPYPPKFSAEWWELRKRIEQGIARESRLRGSVFTEAQCVRSENARLTALGDPDAQLAYERDGLTREQWLATTEPK